MSDIKQYKDQWTDLELLGKGGQGETVKAISNHDGFTIAAIKKLHSQKDPERRARMRREVVSLTTLSHPNLPKVIDSNTEFWEDLTYKLYIGTEYIPGNTLSDFDFSNVTLSDKISLFRRICETVNYCHKTGIIHRDIKPDNIILRNNSTEDPVVIDFGLSFNFDEKDDDFSTPDGQHLGNRFIILPEQKVGEAGKRDLRTDVTCLVGILYYLLTNETPTFLVDEHNQKPHQRQQAKDAINPLPRHQRDVLNTIFDIGFNQLIDKRWQTVDSLLDQLKLFEQAKEIEQGSTISLIEIIKSKSQEQQYQETKFALELYKVVDKSAREVLSEIRKELGDDWSTTQSGGVIHSETAYRNMLAPYNVVNPDLSLKTVIHAFITGNELVIRLVESNGTTEIFRQPIISDLNWTQFKTSLKEHYLREIAAKM